MAPCSILVTGGAGFIGSALVGRLAAAGHDVRVVDDLSVGSRDDLRRAARFAELPLSRVSGRPRGVELAVSDIRDASAALRLAEGVDAIVHLAANTGVQPSIRDPRMDAEVNVMGTLNYLEAARQQGVPRFVFASSGGTVIGDSEPPIDERMVPRPKAPYGASKSAAEGYLSAYHGTFGIDTVALRFGNVYGPGSAHKGSVVARFIRRALAGEALEVYGDGAQTRDFIYLHDLLEAVERALAADGVGGEVFQIATARETSVNELLELLLEALREAGVAGVEYRHAEPLPGEIRRNYSDTRKARRLLGWQARTDLRTGLRATVRWFLEEAERRAAGPA